MEFCKDRVFTALNADELKPGDKVIVADTLYMLKQNVERGEYTDTLQEVHDESYSCRFEIKNNFAWELAYLVERKKKEMCLNCKHYNKANDFRDCRLVNNPTGACPHYEAEKHYRPFKDTDELIKVWCDKGSKWQKRELTMPFIWVRSKGADIKSLIIGFKQIEDCNAEVFMANGQTINTIDLYAHWTFLDGSPCGVEE